MRSRAKVETLGILATVTSGLLATSSSTSGSTGADLRRACGIVDATAEALIDDGGLGAALLACFDAARLAGATLDGIGRLRASLTARTPSSPLAGTVLAGSIQFCLSQEAQILSAMTLTSRDDVQKYAARMNAAFAAAEDAAASAGDQAVYRSLVALHASVTRDLTSRSRPLPRIVTFAVSPGTPALTLANRLYGDADRADEIVAENKVVHPLFLPLTGRALSA